MRQVAYQRKELGMSRKDLADAVTAGGLPMNHSTLANLEMGNRSPSQLHLQHLHAALASRGVSPATES